MTTWIGFDPGERWNGLAVLHRGASSLFSAEAMVLDCKENVYRGVDLLRHLVRKNEDVHVVAEDFRVRPTGYNSWTKAVTARVLGAAEFVTRHEEHEWNVVQPTGDADVGFLGLLAFTTVFNAWKKKWPGPGGDRWQHAISAWRALGQHLMWSEKELLLRFKGLKTPKTEPSRIKLMHVDLVAPTALWRVP